LPTVAAAWIAIVVIVVGLPLGAWWLGGRPVWARSDERARRAVEVHREWTARHRLSSGDETEIQGAIVRGRVLEDARLRAAAVEEARRQLSVWGVPGDVSQRVRSVLALLWLGATLVLVISSTVSGHWSWNFILLAVNFTAVAVPQVVLRRNLRRAVDLNSESTAP
jgi:hypothetical protein